MSSSHAKADGRDLVVRPIGYVRNAIDAPMMGGWDRVTSEIVLNDSLAEALDGIEAFSHVIVLFWMHRVSPDDRPLKVHPRRRSELPLVGLFATRAPSRPNPVGLACVPLVERRGNVLQVTNLDALNGTPVVDIKPYLPGSDAIPGARVADWVQRRGPK